ncbi:metallophosphoesterase family protein [Clostridium sp. D2Q-14]|uniref:metallophosphoesterase family protein n=1 Tax=Anaeromonas gelatinilytica TaxID=2683194 RepID=UPI00193C7220|nr:metallophosphoesterase family protein [Anaeromonas gelatinilytica]MBS4534312.1 metallophosphoesterase family protein [Anaeromonas gelatinilytica]
MKFISNNEDIEVIAYGYSHKPYLKEKDNIIYCNSGSVGRRRFKLPISYGTMSIHKDDINIKIYELFNNEIFFNKSFRKINII